MNSSEYVIGVLKTENNDFEGIAKRFQDKRIVRLYHAVTGLSTEAGEFLDSIRKCIYNDEKLDEINLVEEIGDSAYYCSLIIDEFNTTWEKVFDSCPHDEGYLENLVNKEFKTISKISVSGLDLRTLHLDFIAIKISIETSEILDLIKKHVYYGLELNESKLISMLGGLIYCYGFAINEINTTWEKVWSVNNKKLLDVRFDKGVFSSKDASKRDLKKEREILSKNFKIKYFDNNDFFNYSNEALFWKEVAPCLFVYNVEQKTGAIIKTDEEYFLFIWNKRKEEWNELCSTYDTFEDAVETFNGLF